MIGVLSRFALDRLSGIYGAVDTLRGLSREPAPDMPQEPEDRPWFPGTVLVLEEADPLYGWRSQSGAERSVMVALAELTVDHGPWEAAVALFNPINEEAADVA